MPLKMRLMWINSFYKQSCLSPPLILQRRHTVVTCGICIKRYPVMACHNWDCSDLNRCSPGIMGVTL